MIKTILERSLLAAIFLFASFSGMGQELVPVPFNTIVSNSTVIVEGRVIGQRSFWDQDRLNVYTAHEIELFKTFKGLTSTENIEVITPGGTVGLHREEVHPSLQLSLNDVGVFMLKKNRVKMATGNRIKQFEPYASLQGFFEYNIASNRAANVFQSFTNPTELYNDISTLTGEEAKEIKPRITRSANHSPEATPVISTFAPSVVTAGTKTQITIVGSNFGSTAGLIGFANADDGGATFTAALPTEIVSWADGLIVVEVTKRAGTGPILVQDADLDQGVSATDLTVTYAQLNAQGNALQHIIIACALVWLKVLTCKLTC